MEPIIEIDYFNKIIKHYGRKYEVVQSEYDDIVLDSYLKYYLFCLEDKIESNEIAQHKRYAATIVKNKCIDLKRKYKNESLDSSLDKYESLHNIENIVLNKVLTLSILDNDKDRILYMRYVEQLSWQDIAMICKLNITTVKTRHHRLMKSLRRGKKCK